MSTTNPITLRIIIFFKFPDETTKKNLKNLFRILPGFILKNLFILIFPQKF